MSVDQLHRMLQDGITSLMSAAMSGNVEVVQQLLDACADAEQSVRFINRMDSHGRSAIHYAGEADAEQCVKLLLDSGVDFALRDRADRTLVQCSQSWTPRCAQLVAERAKALADIADRAFKQLEDQLGDEAASKKTKPRSGAGKHVVNKDSDAKGASKRDKGKTSNRDAPANSAKVNPSTALGTRPAAKDQGLSSSSAAVETSSAEWQVVGTAKRAPGKLSIVSPSAASRGSASAEVSARTAPSVSVPKPVPAEMSRASNHSLHSATASSSVAPWSAWGPVVDSSASSVTHATHTAAPSYRHPELSIATAATAVGSAVDDSKFADDGSLTPRSRWQAQFSALDPNLDALDIQLDHFLGHNLQDMSASQLSVLESVYQDLLRRVTEAKVRPFKLLVRAKVVAQLLTSVHADERFAPAYRGSGR